MLSLALPSSPLVFRVRLIRRRLSFRLFAIFCYGFEPPPFGEVFAFGFHHTQPSSPSPRDTEDDICRSRGDRQKPDVQPLFHLRLSSPPAATLCALIYLRPFPETFVCLFLC